MRKNQSNESFLWQVFCCILAGCLWSPDSFKSSLSEHYLPVIIGDHETLNFGDMIFLSLTSLEQLHLLDGFGPGLTKTVVEHDPQSLDDILGIKGIGPKRSAKLKNLLLVK